MKLEVISVIDDDGEVVHPEREPRLAPAELRKIYETMLLVRLLDGVGHWPKSFQIRRLRVRRSAPPRSMGPKRVPGAALTAQRPARCQHITA